MNFRILKALGASLALAATAHAGPVTVDGSLSDWGITVGDNNTSTYPVSYSNPGSGFDGATGTAWHLEDQNDGAGNGGYLGPNAGGQNYDAEFLGARIQGGKLYIAIVTGQRPDNGFKNYSPGDIRIETSGGRYGIEVGGGEGVGTTGPFTILEGDAGTTYKTYSNGYTEAVSEICAACVGAHAGDLYEGGDWILDPINPTGPVQLDPDTLGTHAGIADYIYTSAGPDQHAIIELSIDISAFGGDTLEGVHWRPSCGNDELNLSVEVRRLTEVPEPGTYALFGGALIALGWIRRRKQR